MVAVQSLYFDGISLPVSVDGCEDLLAVLGGIMPGWPFRAAPTGAPAVMTLEETKGGYRRTSPWLTKPKVLRDPVAAACDFIVDLTKAFIADDAGLLCLHCAAVEIGTGLVVFPSTYRAGKSTIAVHLAAAGATVFSDDVMPLSAPGGRGLALGILPRLRLPFPSDAGARFNDFTAARPGPASRRYRYVALEEPGELAPFRSSAAIKGVVLLERREGTDLDLQPVRDSEVMNAAILRNFARDVPAIDIFDRLHSVVRNSRCFKMTYGSGKDAADALIREFAD